MPRKIRQLKADLRAAGFVLLPGRGKGSHSRWEHALHPGIMVTLAGQDGHDVKRYQEEQVADAISKSKAAEGQQRRDEKGTVMAEASNAYDNVSAEELAQARHYRMEMEWDPEDEIFIVRFPDVPGVMTHGATREEAAAMGEDAIITWLTSQIDAGLPVPPPAITARNAPAPPATPQYGPEHIRAIRRKLDVSQHVFADALNVSRGAVSSWEQGVRQPEGAAMRLIDLVDKHPEIVLGWTRDASRG